MHLRYSVKAEGKSFLKKELYMPYLIMVVVATVDEFFP